MNKDSNHDDWLKNFTQCFHLSDIEPASGFLFGVRLFMREKWILSVDRVKVYDQSRHVRWKGKRSIGAIGMRV